MSQGTPLKVGLIGLGNMGQNHLRVLSMLKDVEINFVYDIDIERAKRLALQYGVAISTGVQFPKNEGVKIPDELIFDVKNVDAIILATPTSTHFDYIRALAPHVGNIFVEKPLSDSLETSLEISQLVWAQEIQLQVGFIERFNPAVIALRNVLASAGRVINMDFIRTSKVSKRITDVDVVTDLMIHDIDLALYMNGPSLKVDAYGIKEDGMIAFARATITHHNGAFSNITASRITERRQRQISVTCDNMYVDCDLLRKEVDVHQQSTTQHLEAVSISSKRETILIRPEEALLNELMAFTRLAKTRVDAGTPSEIDGYNAMQIAHKIQQVIG